MSTKSIEEVAARLDAEERKRHEEGKPTDTLAHEPDSRHDAYTQYHAMLRENRAKRAAS